MAEGGREEMAIKRTMTSLKWESVQILARKQLTLF